MTTYAEVMADIRAGRAKGNGARNVPSKYHNQPAMVDGARFDSKAEAYRWQMLKLLQRAGGIVDLEHHVRYPLRVDGVLIATMIPDFRYVEDGRVILDDTKGAKPTADWLIKARLLRALYPKVELRINGVRMK